MKVSTYLTQESKKSQNKLSNNNCIKAIKRKLEAGHSGTWL
jgi:hypothetical protein